MVIFFCLAESFIAEQAKARQAEYHGNQYQSAPEDICPQVQTPQEKNKIDRQNKTNYQLAQMAGVSDKTVQRYKKIIQDAELKIVLNHDWNNSVQFNFLPRNEHAAYFG